MLFCLILLSGKHYLFSLIVLRSHHHKLCCAGSGQQCVDGLQTSPCYVWMLLDLLSCPALSSSSCESSDRQLRSEPGAVLSEVAWQISDFQEGIGSNQRLVALVVSEILSYCCTPGALWPKWPTFPNSTEAAPCFGSRMRAGRSCLCRRSSCYGTKRSLYSYSVKSGLAVTYKLFTFFQEDCRMYFSALDYQWSSYDSMI